MKFKPKVTTNRVLWTAGLLWTVIGVAERFIGWISGAFSKDMGDAVSNVAKFIDSIPFFGDETAQIIMMTGGLIILSVAVGLYFVDRNDVIGKSPRLVEKHRRGETWRNGIDELIDKSPQTAHREKAVAWRGDVLDTFQNFLLCPKTHRDQLIVYTARLPSDANVKKCVQRATQYLRDIKDTVTQDELR